MNRELKDAKSMKGLTIAILIISFIIPVLVALLFFLPGIQINPGFDIRVLPKFHAILNSLTAVLLLFGYYFIRHKNVRAHKISMLFALLLSVLFLVSYVTYHSMAEATPFGGEGIIRILYYVILISHIILAAIIVPFVLFTFLYALTSRFEKHRKIAKITWPLWLYVAISGVLVYLMISPYYGT